MTPKPITVVGNEEGVVYSHAPNTIYAREFDWKTGSYGDSFPVAIPERFQGVVFHPGERIFVAREGAQASFKGKDFRAHIEEPTKRGADLIERWLKGRRNRREGE